jgi:hypothetical protein
MIRGVLALSLVVFAHVAQTRGAQERYDVAVYGATASGVIAAVAAARQGASVVLLEPTNHIGGMVSGGLSATDKGNEKTIGGVTREFFARVGKHYGKDDAVWFHEPHVARDVFAAMLNEAKVKVITGQRLRERGGVATLDRRIEHLVMEDGSTCTATVYIDASYEGDVMAQAGVRYTVGREARSQYNELFAGVQKFQRSGVPGTAKDGQGVLPDVLTVAPDELGAGDGRIQAYNFRLCLTRDPANRVAIAKPAGYDERAYTILARWLAAHPELKLKDVVALVPIPNGKVDANNYGKISSDWVNGSFGYPDGTYAQRGQIWRDHRTWVQGLWWFLRNDPRCPESIRAEAGPWGLARDEFTDTGNWPPQLYIREGRRMVGAYVMTEHDLRRDITKPDGVGMGSYRIDSHFVQRFVLPDGDWAIEGWVGGNERRVPPYQVPYRSLTPRREQCTNLLVPVCLSATHAAWMSIRMEPVFMILGHSAGVAAAMSAKAGVAVQDLDVASLRATLLEQKQVLAYEPPATAPFPPAAK